MFNMNDGMKRSILYRIPIIGSIFSRINNVYNLLIDFHTEDKEEIIKLKEEIYKLKNEIYVLNNCVIKNYFLLNGRYNKNTDISFSYSKRIAVYTAIIGKYDILREPKIKDRERFDYYCFTDLDNIKSDLYKIIHFDKNQYDELINCDSTKINRYIKTHPHLFLKDYEYTIWIDSNTLFKKPIMSWISEYYKGNNMLVCVHPDRDCIYEEANTVIEMGKDEKVIVEKQIQKYRNELYPDHFGLTMNNVIFRKNCDEIVKLNELWWKEIKKFSKRDQLSLCYVAYKNDIVLDTCPLNAINNDYYVYLRHYYDNYENYEYYKRVPDDQMENEIRIWYKNVAGKHLNLENPKTFDEKIQWLKIHDNTRQKQELADKVIARTFIENEVGAGYLIPVIGIYDSIYDVDFDKLPDKYVIKANHGSGWNFVVNDNNNVNKDEIILKFNTWMSMNYSCVSGLELNYKNIVPKIIIEKYMEDKKGCGRLTDYKFFCMNGEPKYILISYFDDSPEEKFYYLNLKWELLNINTCAINFSNQFTVEKPANLNEMIELVSKLCKKCVTPLVRIDLYNCNEKLYVGELTFYHSSGHTETFTDEGNLMFGESLNLNDLM